ncbi:MAG TPA: tetratricopeptide repeat protein [Thermoanaerobaculia bacterium]|nr:tetratricopeptide repeat protein [Thermoanaerobaculia bacterium]
MGRALGLALSFAALLGAGPRDPFAAVDLTRPDVALEEGNRLFREGDLEEALAAYAAGYGRGDPDLDPLLSYNLGVTAHHLGHLPEALLWYRRAEAAGSEDPWLRDNLELVRRALGTPPEGVPSAWGSWVERSRWLVLAGVVLAWGTLALLVVRPRLRLVAPTALLSCTVFTAGLLLDLRGPRAAVLLAGCPEGEGGLPAGTEVWVLADGEGWRVLGDERGLRCPAGTVGLVDQDEGPAFRPTATSGIVSSQPAVQFELPESSHGQPSPRNRHRSSERRS